MDNNKLDIKNLTDQLLQDLKLENLSADKKQVLLAKIEERFNYIILETTLANLNDEQLAEFKAALKNPDLTEELVTEITAQVPGLSEKIDQRLQREYELILKDSGA